MGHVKVYETPPKSAEAAIRKATEGYTTGAEWFVVPTDSTEDTAAQNIASLLIFTKNRGRMKPVLWQGKKCWVAFTYDDREG